MFSPALGRVVRSASSISTPQICTAVRPAAAFSAAQQTFSRRPHQRRLSSSKTSIPPDGSNGSKISPDGSNGSSEPQGTPRASSTKVTAKKASGRVSRGKKAAQPALNVPHVPPTDYLHKPDVKVSSFFSLHRPISLTSTVPPPATDAAFDAIFQTRSPTSRKTMMENIQTLSSGVESLEAALRGQGQTIEDADFEGSSTNGASQTSMVDQLLSQLMPFQPPPPPVPMGNDSINGLSSQQIPTPASSEASPLPQRSWSTEVVITEFRDSAGKYTYSATSEPMIEIDTPASENQQLDEVEIRQPFLERMRQRQNTLNRSQGNPEMLLISVKRQRKLKMKKHKYKKLMKKTRLLRRKLDRA